MKTKIVVLLFAFTTILSFGGCGSHNKENEKSDIIKRRTDLMKQKKELKTDIFDLKKEKALLNKSDRKRNIKEITVSVRVNRKDSNKREWDYGNKPDIYGLITLQSGDAIAIPLTKNSFTAKGYASDVTIMPGDTAYVFLRDQDVDGYQIIEDDFFVFPKKMKFYRNKMRFSKRLKNAILTFNIVRKKENEVK